MALGLLTPYKQILNGTPVAQGAPELYPQWRFLDNGDEFGGSYEGFLNYYFYKEGYKYYPRSQWSIDDIKRKVANKGVRFTKKECLDLPEKTYKLEPVRMTPKQKEMYEQIYNMEIVKLDQLGARVTVKHILTVTMKLQQVTGGFVRPQDMEGNMLDYHDIFDRPLDENPKLLRMQEIIREIEEDEPIVIWARFTHELEWIMKALDRMEVSYVLYDGTLTDKQRTQNLSDFREGKVRVFLGNAAAGGVGLNLQRAGYVIYYSNSFSYLERAQSEDRVHRMGMRDSVIIMDLYCQGSVDLKVLGRLKGKKENAEDILDNYRSFFKLEDNDC